MKRILIFLLLSVAAMAADDTKYFTGTLSNGRGWAVCGPMGRTAYVAGLFDMLKMWRSTHLDDGIVYSYHATIGETVKLLDQFYADSANADVPIVYGVAYVKAKVEGSTPAQLEEYAAKLRQMATALNKAAQ